MVCVAFAVIKATLKFKFKGMTGFRLGETQLSVSPGTNNKQTKPKQNKGKQSHNKGKGIFLKKAKQEELQCPWHLLHFLGNFMPKTVIVLFVLDVQRFISSV